MYILDETQNKTVLINKIADKYRLKPFRVGSNTENIHAPLKERIQPRVEEWLRGFLDADLVVTDSFHACVFAILFEKQFVVIGNEKRGVSRFVSLLREFGLENRLVSELTNEFTADDIDFSSVKMKLTELKEKSLSYLYDHLKYEN